MLGLERVEEPAMLNGRKNRRRYLTVSLRILARILLLPVLTLVFIVGRVTLCKSERKRELSFAAKPKESCVRGA